MDRVVGRWVGGQGVSPIVAITIIALSLCSLAGVILVQAGPESTSRLGLLFGVIGVGVGAIAATIKADQAASQTNGKLEERIEISVRKSLEQRWFDARIERAVDEAMARRAASYPSDRRSDE